MRISNNNLWKLMNDLNINKLKLMEMAGISTNALLEPGEINHSESGRNSQLELTGNNHS